MRSTATALLGLTLAAAALAAGDPPIVGSFNVNGTFYAKGTLNGVPVENDGPLNWDLEFLANHGFSCTSVSNTWEGAWKASKPGKPPRYSSDASASYQLDLFTSNPGAKIKASWRLTDVEVAGDAIVGLVKIKATTKQPGLKSKVKLLGAYVGHRLP